ncbi:MAG TPA: aminotransferase, partial [Gammaproteobacteria bacterium]|nr:aminotransferase [Gammaproteobacteria bacterium]
MELIDRIRDGVIGDRRGIQTPFGTKPLVYADYTASGRSLDFVEDLIRDQVLPLYANTHSESSYTGAQTTALREQARTIIRRAVGGSDDDQVIFCGAGATAAINKLIDILNLRLPADLAERHALLSAIPLDQRPIVFIGPYEHHSNELPWRESIARVKVVPLDASGQLDIAALEQMLKDYGDTQLLIGSFSAASNVTGIKTDVEGVTRLLKQHGALSFWDYAAAAPYVKISMNEERADPVDDSRLSSSQSSNSGSY